MARPAFGLIVSAAMISSLQSLAATFVVTSTADGGAGSLRQAIVDANMSPGADRIHFNIPGNQQHVIQPQTEFPPVSEELNVDGYTQPGATPNTAADAFNGSLRIVLNGFDLGAGGVGLRLESGHAWVGGLMIIRCLGSGVEATGGTNVIVGNIIGHWPGFTNNWRNGNGILLEGSSGNQIGGTNFADRNVISENSVGLRLVNGSSRNVVAGNFIGPAVSGLARRGNFNEGIKFEDSSQNLIGGLAPGSRNIISGNTRSGIGLINACDLNVIQGNYIGVDMTGQGALGNGEFGVVISTAFSGSNARNLIGGTETGARNIISANEAMGISIGSNNNMVQGNFVGVAADGISPLGNEGTGVQIISASGNLVGGAMPGAGNVISGNHFVGVYLNGNSGLNNRVQGNQIGVGADGTTPAGNAERGIDIRLGESVIGGTGVGEGNHIAFNQSAGVWVQTFGQRAAIRGNSIHDNVGLGISLSNLTTAIANDPGDADTGANGHQNYPLLSNVQFGTSSGTVGVTLNGQSEAEFTIDVYANTACHQSGNGQGLQWVGSGTLSTDANGEGAASITILPGSALVGPILTATATDSLGNTSEFSPCLSVVLATSLVLQRASANTLQLAWPAGGVSYRIQETPTLNSPDWQTSSLTPVEEMGVWRAEIHPEGAARFFRLSD